MTNIEEKLTAEEKASWRLIKDCFPLVNELDMDFYEFITWHHFRSCLNKNNPRIFSNALKYIYETAEKAPEDCHFNLELRGNQYAKRLFTDQTYAEHAIRTWNEKFEPVFRRAVN